MHLIDEPHHDGSARYLDAPERRFGAPFVVRLRVPHASAADTVHVRTVIDGEPKIVAATVEHCDALDTWWRAELGFAQMVMHYRFLLDGGAGGYRWCTAAGSYGYDVPDHFDFVVNAFDQPPGWLADTVLYQIMPDRFARSASTEDVPAWAIGAEWDDRVAADWRDGVRQLYGGDLGGITAHLDHLAELGVNAIYMTPFFPAPSAHRYNATSFDEVDPLLGGDDALAELTAAAHARGIRVIGDLTTNHSGDQHEWFRRAQADESSVEAGFYFFDEHPADYVGWFGVPTLPKFRLASEELRSRLVAGERSVVAKWLQPPFELDGWRIDVANMTGRLGASDVNHEVARDIRRTMATIDVERWLVAEHSYDASEDLSGDGWHGTMTYHWFTRPAWCWLRGDTGLQLMGYPAPPPRLGGEAVATSMRLLSTGVPWSAVTGSMNLLDSHDTARFRSVAQDPDRHVVGAAMLLTFPGVPMIFAGDEVGVEGVDGDQARRPFPWDESCWDHELYDAFRALIALRRSSSALRHGGLRWAYADGDAIAYLREAADERVLVHLARAAHDPVLLPAAALGVSDEVRAAYGAASLIAVDGKVALSASGPTANVWRLPA